MNDLTERWIQAGGDLTFNEYLDRLEARAELPNEGRYIPGADAIARELFAASYTPLMSPEELHRHQQELVEEFKRHEMERLRNTAIGPAQLAPLLANQRSTLYWQTATRNLGFLGGLGSVIGGSIAGGAMGGGGGSLSW